MVHKKVRYVTIAILVFSAFVFTGCIPPNEHVGKPAAHSYKDSYYNDGYYNRGYNRGYSYR